MRPRTNIAPPIFLALRHHEAGDALRVEGPGRGDAFLVVVDLGVREKGMIVDRVWT
jgi:hypothetical protein